MPKSLIFLFGHPYDILLTYFSGIPSTRRLRKALVDRWHNLSAEEVLRNLDTSRSGLSRDAARERLLEYGPNELEKKGRTPRIAVFIALGAFFALWSAHETTSLDEARTIAFCILVVSQWFNALNARSDQQSLFRIGVFTNRWLVAGIGLALLLQITVVYAPPFHGLLHTVPLGGADWGLIALVSAGVFVAEEVRKAIAPRLFTRGK